ncbi:class I SAM-dependent DNA methyltransferase [Hydrogenimonas sp.]
MGLDLYADIEPLLGFEEETGALHDLYIEILESWNPVSLIDIGCGSGAFLTKAKKALPLERAYGIDLSEKMVRRAREAGVEAEKIDLCEVKERFDAATAIFDVLNYLTKKELQRFLGCVEEILVPGAVFIADINTLFGFEEIAPGALVRSFEGKFLALDSTYAEGLLETKIEYFEKREEECYLRRRDTIVQYYHAVEDIARMSGLELIQSYPLRMYADEPDKEILLFRKR